MAQACWICDLGSPQVIGGLKENKARKPPFFTINQWGSYGSAGMLLFNCGKLLIPYFSGCGYWCRTYCNLSFALDRVRLQDMSIFWVFVFFAWPLTTARLSKPSLYQWFECSELWARFPCFVSEGALSTKETPLFDPVFWRPHFAHASAKTKNRLQNLRWSWWADIRSSSPSFPWLCAVPCATQRNSTTAKLDFDKRHRDCITYSHCFFLCAITAPKLVCSGFVFSWA